MTIEWLDVYKRQGGCVKRNGQGADEATKLRIVSMSARASLWAEARDFLKALDMAKGVGRIVSGRYHAQVPQKLQE